MSRKSPPVPPAPEWSVGARVQSRRSTIMHDYEHTRTHIHTLMTPPPPPCYRYLHPSRHELTGRSAGGNASLPRYPRPGSWRRRRERGRAMHPRRPPELACPTETLRVPTTWNLAEGARASRSHASATREDFCMPCVRCHPSLRCKCIRGLDLCRLQA